MLRPTSPVCQDWGVSTTSPRAPRNVPTAKRDRVRQHIMELIENAGPGPMRILGVFHPSDSPANRVYQDNK